MSSKEKSSADLLRRLQRKQARHAIALARLEKAVGRVERRKSKLRAIEASIAELERRTAEPSAHRDGALRGRRALREAQLIFNPASGRDEEHNAARLAQIVDRLRQHGIEPRIGLKTSGKAARSLARTTAAEPGGLVIVAAGDGTLNDVASQLMGTGTPMGVIPIGTMNNVARSLGIPLEIDDACALLAMGTVRHVDLGRMRVNGSDHVETFLECAGLGLSALAALLGQAYEKRRWAAIPQALRRVSEARPRPLTAELDGVVIEAATRLVTISNAPLMGNNLLAAPDAKMDDGCLDVSLYDGMSEAQLISHFRSAASHLPDDLKVYRARKIKVTAEDPLMGNSDMSIIGARKVIEIDVLPAALPMIVGNGIALSHPVESAPPTSTFAPDPTTRNGHAVHANGDVGVTDL